MALLTAPYPQSNIDLAGISRMALTDLQRRQAQEAEIKAQEQARQDASWKMAASMVMNIQDQQWKQRESERRERNDLASLALETRKLEIQENSAKAMQDYRNRAYDPEANPLYGAKINTEQARAEATEALAEQRRSTTLTPEQQAQKAEMERQKLEGQSLLNQNRELDAQKKQKELELGPAAKPASPSAVSAAANNQFGVQRDRLEQTRANIGTATKSQTAVEKQLSEAEDKLKEAEMIAKSYDDAKKKKNPQGYQMVESDLNNARAEAEKLRKKKNDVRVTVFKADGTTEEMSIDDARAYHSRENADIMNREEKFRQQGVVPRPLTAPAAGGSDLPQKMTPGVSVGPGPQPARNPTDGLPLPTVSIEKFKTSNGLDDATMSVVTDILFGS